VSKRRNLNDDLSSQVGVRPEAVEPLNLFLDKMGELEENGIVRKCGDNYWAYTEQENLTADDAEELCYGCPLLKLCYDYAVADEISWGVWGGIDFSPEDDTLFTLGDEENYK
jgi:hypothetical protein